MPLIPCVCLLGLIDGRLRCQARPRCNILGSGARAVLAATSHSPLLAAARSRRANLPILNARVNALSGRASGVASGYRFSS